MTTRRSGFTLIELLVVVAIISIIAAAIMLIIATTTRSSIKVNPDLLVVIDKI